MSDFRQLSDTVYASPQVAEADLAEAKALGVTTVINNRPDGEEEGQPTGAEIEAATRGLGMDYHAIPATMGDLGDHIGAMAGALDGASGKVLSYCRTGTRSTLLWALSEARRGRDVAEIAVAASGAGYDIAPVRPMLEDLAGRANG